MAHSRSAKKRVRQNASHRARNRWRLKTVRGAIKEYREAILHGTPEQAQTQLNGIFKILDQTAAAGTIHKNAAARYKSRLAARLNAKKAGASSAA